MDSQSEKDRGSRKYRVFISYAEKDQRKAKAIQNALDRAHDDVDTFMFEGAIPSVRNSRNESKMNYSDATRSASCGRGIARKVSGCC